MHTRKNEKLSSNKSALAIGERNINITNYSK